MVRWRKFFFERDKKETFWESIYVHNIITYTVQDSDGMTQSDSSLSAPWVLSDYSFSAILRIFLPSALWVLWVTLSALFECCLNATWMLSECSWGESIPQRKRFRAPDKLGPDKWINEDYNVLSSFWSRKKNIVLQLFCNKVHLNTLNIWYKIRPFLYRSKS